MGSSSESGAPGSPEQSMTVELIQCEALSSIVGESIAHKTCPEPFGWHKFILKCVLK